MNRQQVVNQVKAIILKHIQPERIWVYGSQAMGTAETTSDIDIAFYAPVDYDKIEIIKDEIEQLNTLIKVDVANIHRKEERFIQRVKATGKVIFSASKQLRAEDAIFTSPGPSDNSMKLISISKIYSTVILNQYYSMSWSNDSSLPTRCRGRRLNVP